MYSQMLYQNDPENLRLKGPRFMVDMQSYRLASGVLTGN